MSDAQQYRSLDLCASGENSWPPAPPGLSRVQKKSLGWGLPDRPAKEDKRSLFARQESSSGSVTELRTTDANPFSLTRGMVRIPSSAPSERAFYEGRVLETRNSNRDRDWTVRHRPSILAGRSVF